MQLRDIVAGPWAITPDMYEEVQGVYARHMRGEKIDLGALEAKIGKPLDNSRQDMTITPDGVAVISLEGVLAKRANLFSKISGGTSTQVVGSQLQEALNDESVRAIVFAVDSPGGAVDGTQQLGDAIFAARGRKPMVAHVDGMCASAAYWIASACDSILIDGDTTAVGSIGVICTHTDKSMQAAQAGVRVTEIKAGKFKAAGSSNGPLGTAESIIQAQVDHTYAVFLGAVARNRGVNVEDVQTDMADGRVFLGRSAIDAGLVDGVSTLAQAVAEALAGASEGSYSAGDYQASSAGVALMAATDPQQHEVFMESITVDKVKAEHPDVANAIAADAVAGELARSKSVRALSRPGCEALIETLASDGKTTAGEAALQVVAAMDASAAAKLAAISADAAEVHVAAAVEPEVAPKAAEEMNPHAIASKARAYQDTQAALGFKVSDAEAVAHVIAQ